MQRNWGIEKLTHSHDLRAFNCIHPKKRYSKYLKKEALPSQDNNWSVTYVSIDQDVSAVSGFITVSFGQYKHPDGKPKFPLSTLHIGRLATHADMVGKGVGKYLMFFAFKMSVELSNNAGLYGVDLYTDDADNGKLVNYYSKHFSFIQLPDDPRHMFAHLNSVKLLVG